MKTPIKEIQIMFKNGKIYTIPQAKIEQFEVFYLHDFNTQTKETQREVKVKIEFTAPHLDVSMEQEIPELPSKTDDVIDGDILE